MLVQTIYKYNLDSSTRIHDQASAAAQLVHLSIMISAYLVHLSLLLILYTYLYDGQITAACLVHLSAATNLVHS